MMIHIRKSIWIQAHVLMILMSSKFNGDVVEDVRFDGEACAICTASTSIMTELVKGKTKEEAAHIVDNYMHMIYEKEYDPELLEKAIAFKEYA